MKKAEPMKKAEVRMKNVPRSLSAARSTCLAYFFILHSSFFILHSGNAAATSKVSTNAPPVAVAPAELVIPKSEFGTPPASGKDPFYPDSARLQQKIIVTRTDQAVVIAPEVRINGFSGNPTQPLVIINNITFGEGDEQMVTTTNAGRARVRCLAIRPQDQTVEIEINGQRRELKFQDRK